MHHCRHAVLLAIITTPIVFGCRSPLPAPGEPYAKNPNQTAAGEVRTCVPLAEIKRTEVVDDYTILFHLRDGGTLINRLHHSCPSLGFERAFAYRASLPSICSTDLITVVHQSSASRRGSSCGLAEFLPYKPPN